MSSKYDFALLVGDPHIDKQSVPEAIRLIKWIVEVAIAFRAHHGTPLIIFTGDQSNDFAIIRAEVLEFWTWAYDYIRSKGFETLSQVGNHDMNQEESASTMSPFDVRTVLAKRTPIILNQTTAAIGFIRSEELFYQTVMTAYNSGIRTILCHAEFEGSQYENGTYAPHGFDLSKYPHDLNFITGHIHKRQRFGNVLCVGTPRPSTRSDIGEQKGIHIGKLGTPADLLFIATPEEVCESFKKVNINESSYDEPAVLAIPDSNKVYVDLHGSRDFVKKVAKLLPASVHVRSTYSDDTRAISVKESEGIPTTFVKFAKDHFETAAVPADLQAEIMKKVLEACPTLKQGVL
jgi:hypothetical protein